MVDEKSRMSTSNKNSFLDLMQSNSELKKFCIGAKITLGFMRISDAY